MYQVWEMGEYMNLEKFERNELPRIKEFYSGPIPCDYTLRVVEAFEEAMKALREERERCINRVRKLLMQDGSQFCGVINRQMLADVVEEKIRSGK